MQIKLYVDVNKYSLGMVMSEGGCGCLKMCRLLKLVGVWYKCCTLPHSPEYPCLSPETRVTKH